MHTLPCSADIHCSGPLFIVYAIFVIMLLSILYILIIRMNPLRSRLLESIRRWEVMYNTPNHNPKLLYELDASIHSYEARYKRFEKLHPFCLCATAGLYGSLCVLFGKMVAELLGSTIRGDNQLASV